MAEEVKEERRTGEKVVTRGLMRSGGDDERYRKET